MSSIIKVEFDSNYELITCPMCGIQEYIHLVDIMAEKTIFCKGCHAPLSVKMVVQPTPTKQEEKE